MKISCPKINLKATSHHPRDGWLSLSKKEGISS